MTLDTSFTLSMVRSVSFVKLVPLLARHSPSIELTPSTDIYCMDWHVRLTGDIIRVQPNLVRGEPTPGSFLTFGFDRICH